MAIATTKPTKFDPESGSLFKPYKPGQGFWTRLGTGIGAGLIILFTVQFLYKRLPVWTPLGLDDWGLYAVLAVFALMLSGVAWWLINRPRHAEFLINTDGEMKKVSWPSKRELWGSTKVVIVFMFFMGAMLFGYDLIFGLVFWFIDIMKIPPFYITEDVVQTTATILGGI